MMDPRDLINLKHLQIAAEQLDTTKKLELQLQRSKKDNKEDNKDCKECPLCGGFAKINFERCKTCGGEIAWIEEVPCKRGDERRLIEKFAKERAQKEEKTAREKALKEEQLARDKKLKEEQLAREKALMEEQLRAARIRHIIDEKNRHIRRKKMDEEQSVTSDGLNIKKLTFLALPVPLSFWAVSATGNAGVFIVAYLIQIILLHGINKLLGR